MILLSATLAAKPVISETGSVDVSGAVDTALAVSAIAGDAPSLAAVEAIRTAFGASTGLKVFVEGTPTKANVLAALDSIRAQVLSSNRFS